MLMPPSELSATAVLDVDWEIDDMGKPDTPFEEAVAPGLSELGVTGTISATYELPEKPEALISFEAYRFNSAVGAQEAVRLLKPGVLEQADTSTTTIQGHETLVVAMTPDGPAIYTIALDGLVLIVGAPNPSKAELTTFFILYFSWRGK